MTQRNENVKPKLGKCSSKNLLDTPRVLHQHPCLKGSKSPLSQDWNKFQESAWNGDAELRMKAALQPWKMYQENPILLQWLQSFKVFLTSNLSSSSIDDVFFKTITLMSLSPKFPWCNDTNVSFLITSPIWIWDLVILRSCLLTTFGSPKLSKVTLFLLKDDVGGKWKGLWANGEGDSKFKWSSIVVR